MPRILHRLDRNIRDFISGRDLVVFAIGLALSTQLQTTLRALIDNLIMPLVSNLTGTTNLSQRTIELRKPKNDKDPGIMINWGTAAQSLCVFLIMLVVLVEVARWVTVNYVPSASVKFT